MLTDSELPEDESSAGQWLERAEARGESVLVVVAHPDDETIGAGARMRRLSAVHVAFVTDGAPRDGTDARAAGFAGPAAYAQARRREAVAALTWAGVDASATTWLDVPDKEAVTALVALVGRLRALAADLAPALVLTHPYEGGHPDHDATAFAVHLALAGLQRRPPLIELGSYHADPTTGEVRRLEFLPGPTTICQQPLDDQARLFKERMLACYASQGPVLSDFPRDVERFRAAPAYDFLLPPHPGPLFYERFGWDLTGAGWRAHAARALADLGLEKGW